MYRRSYRSVLLASGFALAIYGVSGGASAEDWHDELTRQIARDQGCEVAFFSHVVERDIDGKHIIMAKVHCEDKRSFDAFRPSDDQAFDIKACEAPNAKSC